MSSGESGTKHRRRSRGIPEEGPWCSRCDKPEGSRYNRDLTTSVRGLPWDLTPQGKGSIAMHESAPQRPGCQEAPARLVVPAEPRTGSRRQSIKRADLERPGFTAGCATCDVAQDGSARKGSGHSDASRRRLEAAIASNPASKDRYERAHERQSQWVASEVEKSERESKRALAQSGPSESTGAAPSKGPVRDVEMGARGPEGTGATSSSGPVRKVELGLSQPAGGLRPVLNWAWGTPGQGAKQRLRSANWRLPPRRVLKGGPLLGR